MQGQIIEVLQGSLADLNHGDAKILSSGAMVLSLSCKSPNMSCAATCRHMVLKLEY